ncbi:N-acetyl-alpha-D-glucosaminyl L-malate synthase BshA [Actinomadura kijaniata]|uniref:Glycosyltransferase involved in cell wall biosynthesis n=1 Tax=Actinomadura namibiensis TaxID=182080 RepID=A0A7W3QKS7_ACTNM|nr:glycosyltransferase family 4 protein [Actinomadura namibiensis]MBA8950755.1 glycosyltransferase involved in cell wall biosynthesis [Actinomadura namibiensis]
MRILHVSDSYLPRLGGIEVQVDGIARAQRAAGHDVAVATATPGHAGGPPPSSPYPVDRLVLPMPWELPVGRSVGALLTHRKPDVLHVHAGAASPFAWRAVGRGLDVGLPVVLTVHSLWGPLSRTAYRALFTSWSRRHGLVVTAVSEAAAYPVRRVVDGRVPVRVVSNGVDLERWHASGGPVPPGGGPMHVVAVGRLAPRKEPITLLRVLRDVAAAVPIRATIVGEGPARARMERFLRRHGMETWVRLTGRLDQPGVREVLAGADVFLAPAARESFGLAALEARLAGVPVVAQAGSGVADFVRSGREGLLGRTYADLSAALVTLARDPSLRHRMAAHNRATEPLRVTWPRVLEEFADCYEQAAGVPLTPARWA